MHYAQEQPQVTEQEKVELLYGQMILQRHILPLCNGLIDYFNRNRQKILEIREQGQEIDLVEVTKRFLMAVNPMAESIDASLEIRIQGEIVKERTQNPDRTSNEQEAYNLAGEISSEFKPYYFRVAQHVLTEHSQIFQSIFERLSQQN